MKDRVDCDLVDLGDMFLENFVCGDKRVLFGSTLLAFFTDAVFLIYLIRFSLFDSLKLKCIFWTSRSFEMWENYSSGLKSNSFGEIPSCSQALRLLGVFTTFFCSYLSNFSMET